MAEEKRHMYRAAYHETLNDPDTPVQEPDPTTPEETSWKKRYADLRSHSTSLNNRVKELELQLNAAQSKEIKLPSTPEELQAFSQRYPDVFRNIRSIVLTELMTEREHIANQTKIVSDDLDNLKQERGLQKILAAHPDFYEIDNSKEFKEWAILQPQNIQDWFFSDLNPDLCIRGLDLYKADTKVVKQVVTPPRQRADVQVRTRGAVEVPNAQGNQRIWKASEIAKLHPKQFEQLEADIEAANREGRIDLSA